MGCTAIGDKSKFDEFFIEAFGFHQKAQKGVNIDDAKQTKASEFIGTTGSLIFREEIMEHGDESGIIKPWLEGMLSPDIPLEEDLSLPHYSLKIEHVWGFRIEDCRKNLFFLSRDQILYSCSSMAIIQNLDDNTQTLFGGFPLGENKECHDKDITAIAYLKKDVSMVATGQPGINPKILVWSPVDPEVIYAKFEQPKGSKLVSHLSFDHTGRYIGSFGKDEGNSLYIFDLKTKSLYWSVETNDNKEKNINNINNINNVNTNNNNNAEIDAKKNEEEKNKEEKDINNLKELFLEELDNSEYLLDMCFNPDDYELCLVGVEKIKFGNYKNKVLFQNLKRKGKIKKTYTSCCYVNKQTCLIGNNQGKLYIFKDRIKSLKKKVSNGTIQNITYKRHTKRVYISDSFCKVFIYDPKNLDCLDSFQMDSVVKSLDVNINHKIIMGLKNGEIKIKFYGTNTKHEQSIIKSHSSGNINDIAYIPEKKIISVGDDNQILLFNLLSKKCESSGRVNLSHNNLEQINGLCIAYNGTKEHIALGLSNGFISIRKDEKHLNTQIISDIKISDEAVICLKFTDYGDFLLCSTKKGELCLLDTNDNYQICKTITTDFGVITQFDWDRDGKYIQAINDMNKYVFYEIEKDLIELKDPNDMVKVEWPKITCKFNYTVQGVFQGSTNPDFINCVSKANTKKLICAGDEHYLLHLCNYPCVDDNPKKKKYRGHSGKIKKIIWNFDDSKLITIAENDRAIILWNLEEDMVSNDIEQKINL